jgi:NADH-quinone oxidoreductase subunit H
MGLLVSLKWIIVILPILLAIAALTLVERKVLAAIQIRQGPNVIGYGLLQPLADGLKLLIKELVIPARSNRYLFLTSPLWYLSICLSLWAVIPLDTTFIAGPNIAVLVFMAIASLATYGILIGGWSSNSRYSLLGSVRGGSQMISYELILSLLFLTVCILAQSFSFIDLINAQKSCWFLLPLLPFAFILYTSILAEANRVPFDLPEAEAELVSGYNTEYSSSVFAFYFIGEYGNLIVWATIFTLLLLGAFLPFFFLPSAIPNFSFLTKIICLLFSFCWLRATQPRYRWDQLTELSWRVFLPICLAGLLFTINIVYFFAQLPELDLVILSSLVVQSKVDNTIKKAPNDVSSVSEVPYTEDSTKTTAEVVNNVVETTVGYSWTQIFLMGLGVTVAVIAVVGLIYYIGPPADVTFSPEVLSLGQRVVDIMEPILLQLSQSLERCTLRSPEQWSQLMSMLSAIEDVILTNDVQSMSSMDFMNALFALFQFISVNQRTLNMVITDPDTAMKVADICDEIRDKLVNG